MNSSNGLGAGAIALTMLTGAPVVAQTYDQDTMKNLDRAIDAGIYKDVNGIVVMRNGKLFLERYYNGADADSTHNPRSVGKSFAATVLGIAIDEGHITSLDQSLSDFYDLEDYDNYSEQKAAVTLRHLVTMSSGFEGYDFDPDSPGNEENMYPTADWVRWTPYLSASTRPCRRDNGAPWTLCNSKLPLRI